jgi:hypothetical protein
MYLGFLLGRFVYQASMLRGQARGGNQGGNWSTQAASNEAAL